MKLFHWSGFSLRTYILLLGCWCISMTTYGQEAATLKKEGDRAYRNSDYSAAEKSYQKIPDSKKDASTNYNLGNALIRQNKNDDAVRAYDQALEDSKSNKEVQFRAHYNKGNALFNQKKFKEAAESYKQALRMQPHDGDARNNLSLTLQYLKQQQEQQRQEGDQNTSKPQDSPEKNNTSPKDGKNNPPSSPPRPEEGNDPKNAPPQQTPKGNTPPKDQPGGSRQESEQLLRMIDKEDGRVSTKMQQKTKAKTAPKGKDW